ncbi:MAG: PD40 domain-containing protein [Proteobacteria bacterium]|nr:PD40 domain-containing protein [Pseudomonadota bacterium]
MKRISIRVRLLGLAGIAALAGACSSGGSVELGSGQSADPGSVDFPIAYVKRTIPATAGGQLVQDDVREMRDTLPDADLFFRDRASPSSAERNITDRVTGSDPYDIKDVDVSSDGKKIVFAMRGPLDDDQDEEDPPSWAIWEYDIPSDDLHRVITSATIANEGNDVGPQYLPDGRIVFTSTRQRQSQAILRDEGKPGFEAQTDTRNESAFVLHVMKADGTDIHQISFNQSHDLSPSVMNDGRVLFSRWDGATGRGIHLYTANPDGTNLQLLYGARSHNTGTLDPATGLPSTIQFTRPREMQNGRILSLVRPFTDTDLGGDLTLIDASMYVENTQPLASFAGNTGPAQSRATPNQVVTVPGPSPGGRFRSAYPLWDNTNRILVSWSQCRLLDTTVTPNAVVPCTPQRLADPAAQVAPPLYSAFIFDPADNTFKPLFQPVEGIMITDLVAAQPRALPAVILDKVPVIDFDPDLQTQAVGILDIRSVYDFDGTTRNTGTGTPSIGTLANPSLRTADQRPARFLRIEKPVSIGDDDLGFPDIDNAAFGTVNFMREILGYVPIEPDGSVSVRVPANVAFVISILDKDGRRLFPGHRNWLQIRAGETRKCNGCHQAATGGAQDLSHGRDGTSVAAWTGASSTRFPGTVATFSANTGETMAQVKARTTCVPGNTCSQLPSVNLNFVDDWTDPAVRAPDAAFAYTYGGAAGLQTLAPTSAGCQSAWSSVCRIVINYTQQIHPLWYVDRTVRDPNDNTIILADHTCTACHTPVDPANNTPRVPAGQLDLADGDSNQQALHKAAYRELLFASDELELVGGSLVPRVVTTIDPTTGQPVQTTPQVPASLAATSARGSTRFFSRFATGGTHAGYLSPAELRLISEWVDIGAQYFNNPFDPAVPLN